MHSHDVCIFDCHLALRRSRHGHNCVQANRDQRLGPRHPWKCQKLTQTMIDPLTRVIANISRKKVSMRIKAHAHDAASSNATAAVRWNETMPWSNAAMFAKVMKC